MDEDIKYDKSIMHENLKIYGWVAREDIYFRKGRLFLFKEKPIRDGNYGWKSESFLMELNKNSFINLKWSDKPIKVEITINYDTRG